MTEVIQSIHDWISKAIPEPTRKNQHTQLGVHFEEVGEMIHALVDTPVDIDFKDIPDLLDSKDLIREALIIDALRNMDQISKKLKEGDISLNINEINRVDLLDALCDQIVTAVGVAYMFNMDIVGALKEVDASNWSKFDEEGNPLFDQNHKIMKGQNYFKACLDRFA